ncbi:MAG: DnaJ domain-containing protein [Caulobacterales bacterium]|nr:DnaJ domain-containing protein [Caulobacterales bacterium]
MVRRVRVGTDPYGVLGVARDASADDIRSAYRKLAKELHPDARPGDKAAEERFKRVTAAFNLLSDEDKRRRFDRGEIDADGNETGGFGGFHARSRPRDRRAGGAAGGRQFADLEDILSGMFGSDPGTRRPFQTRGEDVRYRLEVSFTEAAAGGRKRVVMSDGKSLDLVIPEGVRTGQSLRLRGQGAAASNGGPPGDALVEITVAEHPYFDRVGDDIRLELPITIKEAVQGARVRVPTVTGPVTLTVPKGSNSGAILRLRGKGVKGERGRGDQLVRLVVTLPERPDPELQRFVSQWDAGSQYNPRRSLDM